MDEKTPLEKLTAEVAEIATVVDAAVTLINGLAAQLRDAVAESATFAQLQVAIGAQADALDATAATLAAAITANTPAAPETPDAPTPDPNDAG